MIVCFTILPEINLLLVMYLDSLFPVMLVLVVVCFVLHSNSGVRKPVNPITTQKTYHHTLTQLFGCPSPKSCVSVSDALSSETQNTRANVSH